MSIKTEMLPKGEVLVRFEGALNRRTVPGIRKQLLRTGRNRAVRSVVADFSEVSEMDTAGIAVLIELMQTLSGKDGELQLTGMSEAILRIIRLARLEQIFEIQADSPAASVESVQ